MTTVLDDVKRILSDVSGVPVAEIADDRLLGDHPARPDDHTLGLDSLDKIEVIMDLETEFGIDIPECEASQPGMNSAAGLAAYVQGKTRHPATEADGFYTAYPKLGH